MRILLILVGSLLTACNSVVPNFPNVKYQYSIVVRDGVANCLKYDIVTGHPYKIKFKEVVVLTECNNLNGFTDTDTQLILNYIDDLFTFAEAHKKCLVK